MWVAEWVGVFGSSHTRTHTHAHARKHAPTSSRPRSESDAFNSVLKALARERAPFTSTAHTSDLGWPHTSKHARMESLRAFAELVTSPSLQSIRPDV